MAREVALYFDFISPYSWLALRQADSFGREHGIAWTLRPVVYGALLNATGLTGPAEIPVKRSYTFEDVWRCAEVLGIEPTGPPAHPFRSLEALRTQTLFSNESRALELAVAIADACWVDGADLTDIDTLASIVRESGFDASDLKARITDSGVKQSLRAATEQAVVEGVFGVPTFVVDGERFWGHDRMPHLAAFLSGDLCSGERARSMTDRPVGLERRRPDRYPPDP